MVTDLKDIRFAQQPVISVKRKVWRQDDPGGHLADAQFKEVRDQVLSRDDHTCVYCRFRADTWQEVHHLDGDHRRNDPDNLVTACTPCHAVAHIGFAAIHQTAFLAVIPELTQTEINSIARATFVLERIRSEKQEAFMMALDKNANASVLTSLGKEVDAATAFADRLTGLYALFQYRGQDTLKAVSVQKDTEPVNCSALAPWAAAISALTDENFENRHALIGPLRLVPALQMFKDAQIEYYAKNLAAFFDPERWTALYQHSERF